MAKSYSIKIVKNEVTPFLNERVRSFPVIAYRQFIHPSLKIIEEHTTDYVPRNSDPPPKIDGFGKPGGKEASGTLQTGFYDSPLDSSVKEAKAVFGYIALDTYKGELYALDQYNNEDYYHPARYPGHKPQDHFLDAGVEDAKDEVLDELTYQYKKFWTKK